MILLNFNLVHTTDAAVNLHGQDGDIFIGALIGSGMLVLVVLGCIGTVLVLLYRKSDVPLFQRRTRVIIGAVLFFALAPQSHDFYTLMKFLVFPVMVSGAIKSYQTQKPLSMWLLFSFAVIFNPIIAIHLQTSTWKMVDLAAALTVTAPLYVPVLANRIRECIKFTVLTALSSFVGFAVIFIFSALVLANLNLINCIFNSLMLDSLCIGLLVAGGQALNEFKRDATSVA
jgi:hypothetical protein